MQLRLELQSTKKGSMSMIDYIMKIKGATDNLAAIGEPVLEQDWVMNLLGGLGSDYNVVVTAINIRDDKISLEAIHSMLLAFEHRLEQQSSIEQMSANYASSSNNRGGGRKFNGGCGQGYAPNNNNYTYSSHGRGGRNGQGRRQNSSPSEKPQCQLCGKFGHTAQICYHSSADESWYLDSGASHHLTQNLGNLTSTSPYTGTDRVTIVNLISVAKFCSDNNALIEFHSNAFFVKDRHTKMVLAQGKLEMGFTIGIAHRFSYPYNSAQNGRVERKHRHVVETGRGSTPASIIPTSFSYSMSSPIFKYQSCFIDSHSLYTSESPIPTDSSSPLDTSSSSLATDLPPESFLGTSSHYSCSTNDNKAFKDPNWTKAMEMEIVALHRNHIWDLVEQTTQCQCDWLPVVKATTIRIILTVAISFKWEIQHVDVHNAFLNESSSTQISSLIAKLDSVFALRDLGQLSFFLGIEVSYNEGSMNLSQTKYISDLRHRTEMFNTKPTKTPSAVGKNLSKFDGDPMTDVTHYRSVVEHFRFTDADWGAHLDDKRNSSGYLVYLRGNLVFGPLPNKSSVSQQCRV
ncbi:Retrovirus-related Pol polyprotein from transposon RE1 [Vitis vinifera]|uniref:Retrovirus-related Pol polyprotein from transposon RE1 n=1 Tax=Vitis vinifera TaxID=29760 RepID=A0A438HLP1_VITVI|nr:Retrovirus-related Pol polyprotein from transposon RE1 [Vitis vinifera]